LAFPDAKGYLRADNATSGDLRLSAGKRFRCRRLSYSRSTQVIMLLEMAAE